MEDYGDVEATPSAELHICSKAVRAGRECGAEAVDGSNRLHPAVEQRQLLSGSGVSPHVVRGSVEAKHPSGFANALGRQVVSLARRQVGCAVAHAPDDALAHEVAQSEVDRGVRLAEDERQLR